MPRKRETALFYSHATETLMDHRYEYRLCQIGNHNLVDPTRHSILLKSEFNEFIMNNMYMVDPKAKSIAGDRCSRIQNRKQIRYVYYRGASRHR